MRWFRLYNEIIDDPKVAKMTPEMFKVFIFLLCLASDFEQNGDIPLSRRELSWRLRIPIKKINSYLDRLNELNIITENPVISLINWDKRQFASDSSKERVKRYRQRHCNVTVTPDVTPPDTDTEQNRIDTDTDTDKKPLPPFKEIISYLNEKSGKKFHPTADETKKVITARWNQGYRLEDFQKVIDIKCKKWLTDPKYIDYLRPQTLFGTKFESYLNETQPKQAEENNDDRFNFN